MKIKVLLLLSMMVWQAKAQTDPVVMTINGKAVTRSEFEYAYKKNKGGGKPISVASFAKQYALYKQKVAAAEAAGLDNTPAFEAELEAFLSPNAIPQEISVTGATSASLEQAARLLYREEQREVDGYGGLVRYGEIFLRVGQHATAQEEDKVRVLADSIYRVLHEGANFEELAKQYSSTADGRIFSVIGKNEVLEEVEKNLYAMQAGELRRPVRSPFGFHILKLVAHEAYPAYEAVRPRLMKRLIMANLRQQVIQQQVYLVMVVETTSLKQVEQPSMEVDEKLKREVRDGLLVAAILNDKVGVLANNKAELERYFLKHKKEYRGALKVGNYIPKTIEEVRPLVEADYKQSLIKGWEKELKRRYKVVINKKILSAIHNI